MTNYYKINKEPIAEEFFKNIKDTFYSFCSSKKNVFDARIFQTTFIYEYFIARQVFAIVKFIMQLKGKFNIDYKLHTSSKVLNELEKKDIKYNEFPAEYQYLIYHSKEKLESFELFH